MNNDNMKEDKNNKDLGGVGTEALPKSLIISRNLGLKVDIKSDKDKKESK